MPARFRIARPAAEESALRVCRPSRCCANRRKLTCCSAASSPGSTPLDSEALKNLKSAELVVAITPFASDTLREIAHVLLPIGTFAETSGTYVNLEGSWQSYAGAAAPIGEARPGWKVLRVLGNLLGLDGFEYQSSEDVRAEVRRSCRESSCPALTQGSIAWMATRRPRRWSISTCTRWMPSCAARLRCRERAKAARRRSRY